MLRVCAECGKDYEVSRQDSQFCTRECKGIFANRRAVRGAELYDLFMAHRYDRGRAAKLKLMSCMNRLAYHYHQDDIAKSKDEGRTFQSWIDPEKVLERRPYIKVQHLGRMRIGR